MSPAADGQVSEPEPGRLLDDLERRQDEVLAELDALDARLREVLEGLGASPVEDDEV